MGSAVPTGWTVTSNGWTPLALASDTPGAGPSTPSSSSATASPAIPEAAPTSAQATQDGRRRGRYQRRLPEDAYHIMREYYVNVTAYPKKPERIQLLERIRQLPGCDGYTEQQVASYFASKRQGDRSRTQQATSRTGGNLTSAQILYPSLVRDPKTLKMLDVLLQETPEPTLDVAVIWAERIGRGAKAVDIVTYANLRRHAQNGHAPGPAAPIPPANGSHSDANSHTGSGLVDGSQSASQGPRVLSWRLPKPNAANPNLNPNAAASDALALPRLPPFQRSPPPPRARSHLPTPASSKSPEPLSPVIENTAPRQPMVVEQWEDEDEDLKDQLVDSSDDERGEDGEKEEAVPEASPAYQIHFDAVATELRDALAKPPEYPAEGPPKTFAALSRWMSQNRSPSVFLDNIKSGKYTHMGMGPDIVSRPP